MGRSLCLALLLALAAPWGVKAGSSINPALPQNGLPYAPSVIRGQFDHAINDIQALQSLNAGASAPSNPSIGTLWLKTPQNATVFTLYVWDGAPPPPYPNGAWEPIASLDAVNHIWMPPLGGGVLPSLLSATTVDLGSVPQASVYITGTNTIQSFGSTAPIGTIKVAIFTAAAVLTNNPSFLILPGGSNITQVSGDVAIALNLGAGTWQVLFDTRIGGGGGGGGGGTVTSVGQTVPAEFTITGSPVTGSGVLAIGKASETANTVWAGPGSGPPAAPSFRALQLNDLPTGITCASLAEGCPYDIAFTLSGVPANSQVIDFSVTRSATCPINFSGSAGVARVGATASTVVTINQVTAGVATARGTFTWGASGSSYQTATIVSSGGMTLSAGDVVQVAFPSMADATLGDVSVTINCART